MDALLLEWSGIVLRWLHILAALAWIGASIYLISWENKFNRDHQLGDHIEGEFWTIQGGDFYFVQKCRGAPAVLPEQLHWFKYEAYLTWISGFLMLIVHYYLRPETMLPTGSVLSPAMAIAASVTSLIGVWIGYWLYTKTRLARNLRVSAVVGLVATMVLALAYTSLFNPRTAFIHVGAAMATLMSANVFFTIIPWHKTLLGLLERGASITDHYASHPGFLSRHNHYMTLPILFLMLGAHMTALQQSKANWLTITFIVLAAALFKHVHTSVQRKLPWWPPLTAFLVALGLAIASSAWTKDKSGSCGPGATEVEIDRIVANRCTSCHQNARESESALVRLDSARALLDYRETVLELVVDQAVMPPANATGVRDSERRMIGCWLRNNR